jgi:hypothetical protein
VIKFLLDEEILNTLRSLYTNPKGYDEVRKIFVDVKRKANRKHGLNGGNLFNFGISLFMYRDELTKEFGFSIPCIKAPKKIQEIGNILEIGAGTGYWTKLLKERGVDVISTDSKTGNYGFQYNNETLRMNAIEAIEKYPERNVFMSWPCYGTEWAFEAAKAMRNGKTLIYIGEGHGGCVADDKFHEYFSNEDIFTGMEEIDIPQWDGIHDRMYIATKNEAINIKKKQHLLEIV